MQNEIAISVSVHLDNVNDQPVRLSESLHGNHVLQFGRSPYPSVAVFVSARQLEQLQDAISLYLAAHTDNV